MVMLTSLGNSSVYCKKCCCILFFIGIHIGDGVFLKACLHSVVNFKKNRIVINGADNAHHAPACQNLVPLLHLTNFGLNLFLAFGLRADNKKDRKSTRLNSSHVAISYAVFCL